MRLEDETDVTVISKSKLQSLKNCTLQSHLGLIKGFRVLVLVSGYTLSLAVWT